MRQMLNGFNSLVPVKQCLARDRADPANACAVRPAQSPALASRRRCNIANRDREDWIDLSPGGVAVSAFSVSPNLDVADIVRARLGLAALGRVFLTCR